MTLLTGKKNDQLSNYSFEVKKNGFKPKRGAFVKGLKDASLLLITKDILDKTFWDESEIEKRSETLITDFLNIWPVNAKIFD